MMSTKNLESTVASCLLEYDGEIPEDELMGSVRRHLGERAPKVVLTKPDSGDRIFEVVAILRSWVHAGFVTVSEGTQGVQFKVRSLDTVKEIASC